MILLNKKYYSYFSKTEVLKLPTGFMCPRGVTFYNSPNYILIRLYNNSQILTPKFKNILHSSLIIHFTFRNFCYPEILFFITKVPKYLFIVFLVGALSSTVDADLYGVNDTITLYDS